MTKRLMIFGNTLLFSGALLLCPVSDSGVAEARGKKKSLAGTVDKGVFTDSLHGYSISLPEDWDMKVMKNKSKMRLVAQKSEYAIPVSFRSAELHTTVPKIKIYVDTCSLSAEDFADSLASKEFRSKQKDAITREFEVLNGKYKRARVSRLRADNKLRGRRLKTTLKYVIEVQKEGRSDAQVVSDFVQCDMAIFKSGDLLILIYCECEAQFYDLNQELFLQSMKSLTMFDSKAKGK